MKHWGVFEDRTDSGKFVAYHVLPLVQADGESLCSAAHRMSAECQCGPFYTLGGSGIPSQVGKRDGDGKLICWKIYHHFDPDHPGSLTYEEWIIERRKAMKEADERSADEV
jgi:hypothetical protein